jgi:polyhydroxyalkanoate synthesis regulator phasin
MDEDRVFELSLEVARYIQKTNERIRELEQRIDALENPSPDISYS